QYERGLQGTTPGLPKEDQSDRKILKSDILIVASAKVAGATEFYSHESKCWRLAAEAGMAAFDLPQTSGNLLTDPEVSEDERGERDSYPDHSLPLKPLAPQNLVIVLREAVGLVAHVLDQPQRRRVPAQPQRLRRAGPVDLLLALRQRDQARRLDPQQRER